MAKIVLGMGTSHTPMLLASDETLPRFLETDMKIKHRDKDGNPQSYEDLLLKADPQLSGMVTPEQLVVRQNDARAATRRLRQVLANAKLDALIVLGDDQNESYLEDCRPAFAVYYGDTIRNDNKQHETYSHLPEWYIKNRAAFFEPEKPRDYPVHSALAVHLIELADGHGLRSRRLQVPARGRRRRPRGRLCAPSRHGFGAAGAGGADIPQHLLPADAAAAEALLSSSARRSHARSKSFRARRASACWPRAA